MNTPSSAAKAIRRNIKFFYFKAAPTIGQKFITSGSCKATREGGIRGLSRITIANPIDMIVMKIFYYQKSILVASITF